MAPVTFEKRRDKEPKTPVAKREMPAAKKTVTNRPTFGSFPTDEQGPVKHDSVNEQTQKMAKTLDQTFREPKFNWKNAAATAIAVLGVTAGVGVALMSRRKGRRRAGTMKTKTMVTMKDQNLKRAKTL